jgi:hypothetical protein
MRGRFDVTKDEDVACETFMDPLVVLLDKREMLCGYIRNIAVRDDNGATFPDQDPADL